MDAVFSCLQDFSTVQVGSIYLIDIFGFRIILKKKSGPFETLRHRESALLSKKTRTLVQSQNQAISRLLKTLWINDYT